MLAERTTQLMQKLGFTGYEAKAYLGLLACQPASAYEVAKKSAIPTSKIYETINKLIVKGVVQPTTSTDEKIRSYVALNPSDFLQQVRETTFSQTNELQPLLEAVNKTPDGDFIWPLSDHDQVVTKSHEIIRQARNSILISCWAEELKWLTEDLRNAESQGKKIALVHFGAPTQTIGATYHHPVEKTLYQEKGGRGLNLVADNTVLIASYRQDGSVDGAWSRSQSFVTVTEDYIKHDVYITKVTRFLNQEMLARFGAGYEKLRDVFDADA